MNEKSKALSILLHEMRALPLNNDQFSKFARLLDSSTDEEIARGTADYVLGLLRVAMSVTEIEKASVEAALMAMRGKMH